MTLKRAGRWGAAVAAVLLATATMGAAAPPPDDDPKFIPGPDADSVEVVVSDRGWTLRLTEEAAAKEGIDASTAAAVVCEGTYFLQRVNNTLEWGSENVCPAGQASEWAPHRIEVKLEGTCNDPFCVLWYTEAGPVTSAWTSSSVTAVSEAETCDTNTLRRFRIVVTPQYKFGELRPGQAVSAPWYDVDCDV